MKNAILFVFLFSAIIGHSQSLPIDFETAVTTSNFIDFDGGVASVIDNPEANGINTSSKVAQIVRDGGEIWAGSKIELDANLDFTTMSAISMKVFSNAPVGTIVKFKLEGAGTPSEKDVATTVSGEWETMTWDFTGTPSDLNTVVFMFDFGNIGNGSALSTFLFDDLQQLSQGTQIDLPVDFESTTINYAMTDFGGNTSALVVDPTDASNMVIQAIKTDQAATWAGTTIGTSGGFATNIPLTLTDSKMTVKVWSPEAGTPIRLKVEKSSDPTQTCETETNTTVSGDWEVMEFDFTNEAPGTQTLEIGLSMGWTYNMASIFFNFGTDGASAGEETYYFDNVSFGEFVLGTSTPEIENLNIFPNPSNSHWTVSTKKENITSVEVYDLQGKLVHNVNPFNHSIEIDASTFVDGIYLARISTNSGTSIIKLVKK